MLESRTGGAHPASKASCQRGAHRHPAVAGDEAREGVFGDWSGEVVACFFGEGEEVLSGFDTNGVDAMVIWADGACACTIESSEGL